MEYIVHGVMKSQTQLSDFHLIYTYNEIFHVVLFFSHLSMLIIMSLPPSI